MASDMDPRSRTVICVVLALQITKNEKRDEDRVILWPWGESDGESHLEAYGGGVLNWHILGTNVRMYGQNHHQLVALLLRDRGPCSSTGVSWCAHKVVVKAHLGRTCFVRPEGPTLRHGSRLACLRQSV